MLSARGERLCYMQEVLSMRGEILCYLQEM